MSCHHQMDQTLSVREAPAAGMRGFSSHWGSRRVFWPRWDRLSETSVGPSDPRMTQVWAAGGSGEGAWGGQVHGHPLRPSPTSHGNPDPPLRFPLWIRLFPTCSHACLSFCLCFLLSAQFGEAPLMCQLLCPVSFNSPCNTVLPPPYSLSLIHSFNEHLLNAWYASNTWGKVKNGQKSLMKLIF